MNDDLLVAIMRSAITDNDNEWLESPSENAGSFRWWLKLSGYEPEVFVAKAEIVIRHKFCERAKQPKLW